MVGTSTRRPLRWTTASAPSTSSTQYEALSDDSARIAGRFADVFRAHMWAPFVDAGMPAEGLGEVVGALEQLGPLAESVMMLALRHALQDFADAFIEAEAARLGIAIPRPGSGVAAA